MMRSFRIAGDSKSAESQRKGDSELAAWILSVRCNWV
jgi:hypothetical protein